MTPMTFARHLPLALTRPLRAGRQALRRLGLDRRGVAMVEFALMLPISMTLFLGGVEGARYVLLHQKVARVAQTMADLTAQSPVGVMESQISNLFLSANMISDPYNILTDGRVFISAIKGGAPSIGNTIIWQRCDGAFGAASSVIGSSDNKDVTLPDGTELEEGVITVIAQASFHFEPMFFSVLFPEQTITHIARYAPRSLSFGVITDDGSSAKDDCSTNLTQYDSNGNAVS
ncbi:TadE/TadG family type IV pilus assembly protein [Parapedomonas caeni]